MALSDNNRRGQVGPSLRGLIYQYERNGVWVTSKWPKKRGKVATAKQKEAQEAFRAVMRAMKLTAADIQSFHRDASKGTPMLPRDTLMAALYGNGPTMRFYSGKVIKPMANKLLSSTVLDAIGWERGDILYRGENSWEVLKKPPQEAVLFYDQGTNKPLWVDAAAVGGNGGYWMPNDTGQRSGLALSAGILFTMLDDRILREIWCIDNNDAGTQLRAGVYECTPAGVVLAVLYDQPVAGVSPGGHAYRKHPMAPEIALEAGKTYSVMFRKVAGSTPGGSSWAIGGLQWPQLPIQSTYFSTSLSSGNPGVGDNLAPTTGWRYSFGIRVK